MPARAGRTSVLAPAVFAHLGIERRQGVDLARRVDEGVACFEIFVTASAPEPASRIDHERVPDSTTEDRGTVGADIHTARPGSFRRVLCHEFLDFANEMRKELSAAGRRSLENFGN